MHAHANLRGYWWRVIRTSPNWICSVWATMATACESIVGCGGWRILAFVPTFLLSKSMKMYCGWPRGFDPLIILETVPRTPLRNPSATSTLLINITLASSAKVKCMGRTDLARFTGALRACDSLEVDCSSSTASMVTMPGIWDNILALNWSTSAFLAYMRRTSSGWFKTRFSKSCWISTDKDSVLNLVRIVFKASA